MILNILLGIAAFFCAVSLIATICSFKFADSDYYREDNEQVLASAVKSSGYSTIARMVATGQALDWEPSGFQRECQAIYNYIMTGFHYRAEKDNGLTEEAEQLKKQLDGFAEETGDLSFLLQEINLKFGIQ